MLITSDTMPPLLDDNGNPVRNGILEVRANSDPESAFLFLYTEPGGKGEQAPNPIHLLSTGRMPSPVYTGLDSEEKEISSAWCFVYDMRDGVKVPVRNYPLQNEPVAKRFALPQSLTLRTLDVEGMLRAREVEAERAFFREMEAETAMIDFFSSTEASYANTLIVANLQAGHSELISGDTIISAANIDPRQTNESEKFEESFLLGSYSTLEAPNTNFQLNQIVDVKGIVRAGGLSTQYGDKQWKVRICGKCALYIYLVCRVK